MSCRIRHADSIYGNSFVNRRSNLGSDLACSRASSRAGYMSVSTFESWQDESAKLLTQTICSVISIGQVPSCAVFLNLAVLVSKCAV